MANKQQLDEDVHISYEDQSKINKFAINNSKLHDIKEEIELKKKELQNLSDAIDELLMADEDTVLPFMYGVVIAHLTVENANEELEKAKETIEKEIKGLESKQSAIKSLLDGLKVQLYSKFGKKINLEENEDE